MKKILWWQTYWPEGKYEKEKKERGMPMHLKQGIE